jgi:ATP-binding cassette subfamily B protein
MLGDVLKNYQEAKASHELVEELLQQQPEIDEHISSEHITALDSVVFEDVSFQYGENKEVLHDINVTLHRGETIAFVGPSGSGKSTIIKLLLGLYPASQGTIRINAQPIISYDPSALKSLIGLVSQDTQLFSGTIRQNLQFVRPEATDEEMTLALSYAQLQDFLADPAGLDLKIGE